MLAVAIKNLIHKFGLDTASLSEGFHPGDDTIKKNVMMTEEEFEAIKSSRWEDPEADFSFGGKFLYSFYYKNGIGNLTIFLRNDLLS